MSPYDYRNVRLVVAEPNPHLRQGLRHVFKNAGFESIVDTDKFDVVEKAVADNDVDLLICDMEVASGAVVGLTRRLRHHELGINPFLVVVTLCSEPRPAEVRDIIDSGSDDLVLKPVSPNTLMERIHRLTTDRKKFVVTTDYIGPDRRKAPRPGSQEIPLLDVPNPLSDRDERDLKAYQRAIDAASRMVNEQKVERHAFQIGYLIEKIVPVYLVGEPNEEVVAHVDRLVYVSEDIGRRLQRSRYGHVAELCSSVRSVARRLRADPYKPDYKDIQLLPELATAIKRAFREDSQSAEVAHDISATVIGRAG